MSKNYKTKKSADIICEMGEMTKELEDFKKSLTGQIDKEGSLE